MSYLCGYYLMGKFYILSQLCPFINSLIYGNFNSFKNKSLNQNRAVF